MFPRSPLKDALIGDGLVPLRSALGQHDETPHCLELEHGNVWTAYGTNHMGCCHALRWLRRLRAGSVRDGQGMRLRHDGTLQPGLVGDHAAINNMRACPGCIANAA